MYASELSAALHSSPRRSSREHATETKALRNWSPTGLICKFPDLHKACSDTLTETLHVVMHSFNLLKHLPSISQTYIQLSIDKHNSTSSINFALTMQAWTQFNTIFIK